MALHGYVSDQSQQQRGLARSIGKNRDELANVLREYRSYVCNDFSIS